MSAVPIPAVISSVRLRRYIAATRNSTNNTIAQWNRMIDAEQELEKRAAKKARRGRKETNYAP